MISIFTIPKSFSDNKINIIQRNALKSWSLIDRNIEIIVLGNENGTQDICKELNLKWIPEVKTNQFGTPLLDSAFSIAKDIAKFDTLMYSNADIIFFPDLMKIVERIPKHSSLATGRRIDVDVFESIDFENRNWQKIMYDKALKLGKYHSPAGIDYFIFDKSSQFDMPPFAVGRVGWDNWLIAKSRKINKYTIDTSSEIIAIHQNHSYSGVNIENTRKTNPEALNNRKYVRRGGAFTIDDCNWKLTRNGLKRNIFCDFPYLKRYIKSFF